MLLHALQVDIDKPTGLKLTESTAAGGGLVVQVSYCCPWVAINHNQCVQVPGLACCI